MEREKEREGVGKVNNNSVCCHVLTFKAMAIAGTDMQAQEYIQLNTGFKGAVELSSTKMVDVML